MASVLLVSEHPLLAHGVEHLLRHEAGLTVVGVEADVSAALEKVVQLKPDIVILDSNDPNCDPAPILAQILRWKQRATIIGLNLSDNVACVCSMEHTMVRDVSDLLDILQPAVSAVRTAIPEVRV